MNTLTARVGGISASIQIKRPKFQDLWSNYPRLPAGEVYKLVGGEAHALYQENPKDYANACALRLSRALNYSGVDLSKSAAGYKVAGSDGKRYLLRVKDMIIFVKKNYGNPEIERTPEGVDIRSEFLSKKGIIIFSVTGWIGATGHVTLWNGDTCGDGCYFTHDQPGVNTQLIQFWELK